MAAVNLSSSREGLFDKCIDKPGPTDLYVERDWAVFQMAQKSLQCSRNFSGF